LFHLVLVTYAGVGALTLALERPLAQVLGAITFHVGLYLVFIAVVLEVSRRRSRFLQTATAALGVETFLGCIALPLLFTGAARSAEGVPSVLAALVLLLIVVWSIDIVGFILALPIVVYHTWSFLSPALFEKEKKLVVPAVVGGFVLFLLGVAMAYFLVLPLGLRFLLGFQTQALTPIITIGEYLRFATRLILAFGLIFELPLVSLLLSALGLITAHTLRRFRRHAIVGVAAVSAILTPADVLTMLMMMGPLLILYEISILLVAMVGRRQVAEQSAQAAAD